jgi:hypothetical protein
MAEALLLPYLIALFLLPILARWRWGVIGSLVATVVALGLVALVFYLLEAYRVFPNPYPVGQTSGTESPMVQLRRSQGYSATILVLWVMFPAYAALMGGALALAWSVVLVLWRAAGKALR